MLVKKKKLSRKEIKQDKLVEFSDNALNFINEYQNKILLYGGILVVVVVAVIFFINQKSKTNDKAGLALSQVMSLYDAGAYLEAIEGRQGTNLVGLKNIVDEYGGTENGETAKIYLANCYSFLGRTEEANNLYDDYSGNIDVFKAAALAGKASYLSFKEEYTEAADLYFKASTISKENALRPDYLLQAGINYFQAGNHEDAKEIFNTIKEEFRTSTAYTSVDRYLTQIEQ